MTTDTEEVQHLFDTNLAASGYIERSGGTTNKADKKRIYVVKTNGRVFLPRKSGWFRKNDVDIQPGAMVAVPLDADRIKSLAL
jgi:polysaccharide biosynthesis/export protein